MTTMQRRTLLSAISLLITSPPMAWSADIGELADEFSLPAALAGVPFTFTLSEALARGPVVLYFFPAAFSEGCSIEAHGFAESIADFKALGASVLGVSTDDQTTITRFSMQSCQGKFPVAADEQRKVTKAFDALMRTRPEYATRVSFVIAPDRRIVFVYRDLEPTRHIERTLAAVRLWSQAPGASR